MIAGFVWPRKSYNQSAKKDVTSTAEDPTVLEIMQKTWKGITIIKFYYCDCFFKTNCADIRSVHYVFLAFFVALLILKSNFFLGTYETQFSYYMSKHQQDLYLFVHSQIESLFTLKTTMIWHHVWSNSSRNWNSSRPHWNIV